MENVTLPLHPMGKTAFGCIERVEAPETYKVVFKLKYPYGPFLYLMYEEFFSILPKHLYEGTDIMNNEYNIKPVGAGPYMFAERVAGSHYIFVRNPNYFRSEKPYLDRIVFKIMDAAPALLALENGEVDFIPGKVPFPEIARLSSSGRLTVSGTMSAGSPDIDGVFFNMNRTITGNVLVRRAISHAIDRTFLLNTVYAGKGTLTPTAFPSTLGWCFNSSVPFYGYNVTRANELLDAAGYPRGSDGWRFTLDLVSLVTRYEWERGSAALSSMLEQVGIKVNVLLLAYQAMCAKLWTEGNFDLALIGYTCLADPNIGIERIFSTASITGAPWTNVNSYSNADVDKLFEDARMEVNQTLRGEYFKKIQQILHEEEPEALVCARTPIFAWNNDFGGFPTGPLHCSDKWDSVWWKNGHVYSPWDCQTAISQANATIATLKSQNYDVSRSQAKLAEAYNALSQRDYTTAKTAADLAPALAIAPSGDPGDPGEPASIESLLWITGIAAAIVVALVVGALVLRRRRK
jgi:peptide/nickel transport system substrate-binding protein